MLKAFESDEFLVQNAMIDLCINSCFKLSSNIDSVNLFSQGANETNALSWLRSPGVALNVP